MFKPVDAATHRTSRTIPDKGTVLALAAVLSALAVGVLARNSMLPIAELSIHVDFHKAGI